MNSVIIVGLALVLQSGLSLAAEGGGTPARRLTEHVSMVQLLANPVRYHGKAVIGFGYYKIGEEETALYFTKEHAIQGDAANAIWIRLLMSPEELPKRKSLNRRYVIVQGSFDQDGHGHLGCFPGEIRAVRLSIR